MIAGFVDDDDDADFVLVVVVAAAAASPYQRYLCLMCAALLMPLANYRAAMPKPTLERHAHEPNPRWKRSETVETAFENLLDIGCQD